MKVDLSEEEVEAILRSLEFSKERVREAAGTPYELRQQNLAKIEQAITAIRKARSSAEG